MSDTANTSGELVLVVDRLNELLVEGQDWLVRRVAGYAADHGYGAHAPDAWRESVSSISDALFQAAYDPRASRDHDADGVEHDPVTAFGVLRARNQFRRGATLHGWLGLMKYYRRAFTELVLRAGLPTFEERACCDFVEHFFDRLEIGFSAEWARLATGEPAAPAGS